MVPHSLISAYLDGDSQVLWEDGERVFRRGWRPDDSGEQRAVLIVVPAADYPPRSSLDRLTHEYELKDETGRRVGSAAPGPRAEGSADRVGITSRLPR
jgi:hypothetical protein